MPSASVSIGACIGVAAAAAAALALHLRSRSRPAAGTSQERGITKPYRLCVFCGSSTPAGADGAAIKAEAERLGRELVRRRIELVYGGGSVGIMGALARSVDEAGGVVRGIIPRALAPKEASGAPVQPNNVEIVETMHQRKRRMAELSDGFIALPGGFGTFEELLEMITWTQLGIHDKSVGILNVAGFYTHLLKFFRHASSAGFIVADKLDICVVEETAEDMVRTMVEHRPPEGYLKTWT